MAYCRCDGNVGRPRGLGAIISGAAPRTSILQDPRFAATYWSPEAVYAPKVTRENIEGIAASEGIELGTAKTAVTEMLVGQQVLYPTANGGTYAAPAPSTGSTPTVSPTGEVPAPAYEPPPPAPEDRDWSFTGGPVPITQPAILDGGAPSTDVSVTVEGGEAAEAGIMPRGFGLIEAAIAAGLAALLASAWSRDRKRRR